MSSDADALAAADDAARADFSDDDADQPISSCSNEPAVTLIVEHTPPPTMTLSVEVNPPMKGTGRDSE
jgi:hypothetical protein